MLTRTSRIRTNLARFAANRGGAMNTAAGLVSLTARQKIIGERTTFRQWCEQLAKDGLKVDGKPFRLSNRPAMAWIYDQIPATREDAYRRTVVLQKCAQVGFTVMEMLAVIYLGIKFGPSTVGMFLPDMNLAGMKSSERFMPIVRSVPPVHALMTQEAGDGSGRKSGEGNVTRRRIAEALFVFSWTSGRATTESIPMDVLSFDEVQEMTLEQMEKTRERLSASAVRFTLMGSTANWPDADINHWFKRGTKHRFHTECPSCGRAEPLDEYFPNCIRWDNLRNRYRYVCRDGHWIDDPQVGEWIAEAPEAGEGDAPIISIHFPQFLSPDMSPGEIIEAYNAATDLKNFFNRKLGKPYLDPSQVPVTMEHLNACVAAGREAGVVWKTRARGTFMGIDQMGAFNVVVIKERLPDGRQAVIHVEEIYSDDPFARCSELMEQFGVQCAVVELNPNYNDAKRFANRHPGRVFLCNGFGALEEGMVRWGDAPKLDPSERRTTDEDRDRYTVKADQYKTMQVAMSRIVECKTLFPDPNGLVQEVIEKGVRQTASPLMRAFEHFTKTALIAEKDPETNKFKRSVKKVGIDPHFSYANQLCDVAWSRAHGTATFILPDGVMGDQERAAQMAGQNLPGIDPKVATMLEKPPLQGFVCGRCNAFDEDSGRCSYRELVVKPRDPACEFYDEEMVE